MAQLSIHDGIKTQDRKVSVEGHRSRNAWAVIVMERVGFIGGWVWVVMGMKVKPPRSMVSQEDNNIVNLVTLPKEAIHHNSKEHGSFTHAGIKTQCRRTP